MTLLQVEKMRKNMSPFQLMRRLTRELTRKTEREDHQERDRREYNTPIQSLTGDGKRNGAMPRKQKKEKLKSGDGGVRKRDVSDIEVMTIIPTMTTETTDHDRDRDHGHEIEIIEGQSAQLGSEIADRLVMTNHRVTEGAIPEIGTTITKEREARSILETDRGR